MQIPFLTRSELALAYRIDRKTLYRRLQKAGLELPPAVRFSPREVEKIIALLGPPPGWVSPIDPASRAGVPVFPGE